MALSAVIVDDEQLARDELAYLLKNRFYIGEVVYRGEVYRAEHESILQPTLFEAVQGKLAAQAVALRCRLRGSPTLLSGRLFDNREFNYGR